MILRLFISVLFDDFTQQVCIYVKHKHANSFFPFFINMCEYRFKGCLNYLQTDYFKLRIRSDERLTLLYYLTFEFYHVRLYAVRIICNMARVQCLAR